MTRWAPPRFALRPLFSLCEKSVRVDQFEAGAGLESVPLMDVAMHEHGPFVVVGADAMGGTGPCVVDSAFRTGSIELFPCGRDEFHEPSALLRSSRQAMPASWPP